MPADGLGQRFQEAGGLADPAGQRRASDVEAVAGEDLALPVERQVVGILADEDMGQEAGAGPTLLDRARGQRHLMDALAAGTGPARPHDAVHHETPRHIVEFFGDVLAQRLERAAAGRTGLTRRQGLLDARQMVRQGLALWLDRIVRRGGVRFGLRFDRCLGRRGDRLVLQRHGELVEALCARAEAVAAQPRELVPELEDHKVAVGQFALKHADGTLEGVDIVGQIGGRSGHGANHYPIRPRA